MPLTQSTGTAASPSEPPPRTGGCWSRSPTTALASPRTSGNVSSSLSTRRRTWAKARGSVWTSRIVWSWRTTREISASFPNPATPASRCGCRSSPRRAGDDVRRTAPDRALRRACGHGAARGSGAGFREGGPRWRDERQGGRSCRGPLRDPGRGAQDHQEGERRRGGHQHLLTWRLLRRGAPARGDTLPRDGKGAYGLPDVPDPQRSIQAYADRVPGLQQQDSGDDGRAGSDPAVFHRTARETELPRHPRRWPRPRAEQPRGGRPPLGRGPAREPGGVARRRNAPGPGIYRRGVDGSCARSAGTDRRQYPGACRGTRRTEPRRAEAVRTGG